MTAGAGDGTRAGTKQSVIARARVSVPMELGTPIVRVKGKIAVARNVAATVKVRARVLETLKAPVTTEAEKSIASAVTIMRPGKMSPRVIVRLAANRCQSTATCKQWVERADRVDWQPTGR